MWQDVCCFNTDNQTEFLLLSKTKQTNKLNLKALSNIQQQNATSSYINSVFIQTTKTIKCSAPLAKMMQNQEVQSKVEEAAKLFFTGDDNITINLLPALLALSLLAICK